jgi:pyruvate/2-oxoglutarate dehydrogenase complex dihydrolipoamide dehydrogenase (E3) component
MTKVNSDICIIGAGPGGLTVAAVATQLGLKTVLVENHKMGGDCLNYGCVPSKSLLATARIANIFRMADQFGIQSIEPKIDFAKVHTHVQNVINTLAEHDSVKRFTELGVKVIFGDGKFVNKKIFKVNDQEIQAKYFVIATGAKANIPPIPGLDKVKFFTNETIFSLTEKPSHLMIIGGGPIGCELGQAFALLGVKISILDLGNILPNDESDLVNILKKQLLHNGIAIYENIKIDKITSSSEQAIEITFTEKEQQPHNIQGSHLLIATGRKVNLQSLNLAAAKVKFNEKGITVNKRLRTSNKKIFAIGDAVGQFQFTHVANYHAGIVIKNIMFRIPAAVNYHALPWVTYTEPELAHVGITEKEVQKKNIAIKITEANLTEIDRAQIEHQTLGRIKVITNLRGRILGVSIFGKNAGELITPWILAIQNKMTIKAFVQIIIPYPTMSEIHKLIANTYYKKAFFSDKTKKFVKFLQKFSL